MHLQPKLYQIQSGDWPTCHSPESNPGLLRGRREYCHYTTQLTRFAWPCRGTNPGHSRYQQYLARVISVLNMLENSSNFLFFAGYSCLLCTVPVENVSHNFSTTGQNFDLSSIFDRFVSGVTLTLGALLAGILRPLWPIWCPSLTSCILPFFLDDFVFVPLFLRPWSNLALLRLFLSVGRRQ